MAPPRCTWKPSTWLPSSSSTSLPLSPMSATWVRAQALGQPLTLTVIGVSRSGKRCSSSATRSRARSLVSTIASLQNSMPVQAIVERRQLDGRAYEADLGPGRRPAASTSVAVDAEQHELLVRREPGAGGAVLLDEVAELDSSVPEMRPAIGRDADVELAVLLLVHADVVAGGRPARLGGGVRDQLALRGTRSRGPRGTSPRPSRRPGTSAGHASAAGGSRSRGRSTRRPPRRRPPRRAGSRRRASGRASGWWTARRRPTGRSRGRARGGRCRRRRRR